MASYRKRPRKVFPPPLEGGGKQSNDLHSIAWGRGKTSVSRQLRAQESDAEKKLWSALRRKQVNGLRFRRQFPLGPYFADFVCLSARLVIEVDGSQHGEAARAVRDARRTTWLEMNGFRVLRFWAGQVMTDLPSILDSVEIALRETPPPNGPAQSAGLFAPSRKGRGNV